MTNPPPTPAHTRAAHPRRLHLLSAALLLAVVPAASAQSTQVISGGTAVTAALKTGADVNTAQANLTKAQAASRAAQADPATLAAGKLNAKNAETLAQATLRGAKLAALQNTIGAACCTKFRSARTTSITSATAACAPWANCSPISCAWAWAAWRVACVSACCWATRTPRPPRNS